MLTENLCYVFNWIKTLIFEILRGRNVLPASNQAPVVQKLDSAIHRINHYPVDNAIGFPNTYPLDNDLSGG